MVKLITDVGNGYVKGTEYNIVNSQPVFSRTIDPTWDTSSRDRTMDAWIWVFNNAGYGNGYITRDLYERYRPQLITWFNGTNNPNFPKLVNNANEIVAAAQENAAMILQQKQAEQEQLKAEYLIRHPEAAIPVTVQQPTTTPSECSCDFNVETPSAEDFMAAFGLSGIGKMSVLRRALDELDI